MYNKASYIHTKNNKPTRTFIFTPWCLSFIHVLYYFCSTLIYYTDTLTYSSAIPASRTWAVSTCFFPLPSLVTGLSVSLLWGEMWWSLTGVHHQCKQSDLIWDCCTTCPAVLFLPGPPRVKNDENQTKFLPGEISLLCLQEVWDDTLDL